MSVAARFENVTVRFGGRPAVESTSFTIPAGMRTAMVGPNGGGKTTLARVLLGILRPDDGLRLRGDACGGAHHGRGADGGCRTAYGVA